MEKFLTSLKYTGIKEKINTHAEKYIKKKSFKRNISLFMI
jgi:hypothetical protein